MSGRRSSLLAVVLVDLVPFVGVAVLGWSPAALVVVYWVELGVDLGFAALRALFARRPPEHESDLLVLGAFRHRRGGLSVPGTALHVQAANVPVVVVLLPVFGAVWLLTGGVALSGIEATVAGEAFDGDVALTAALGILGVVVGRGFETATDYVLEGRYESVSVQGVLQSAAWPVMVVGLALVLSGAAATSGAPATVVLVALVGTKSLFDLAGVYRDRLVAFDERSSLSFGWASEPGEWSTVETDLREPVTTVRSRWPAVLLDGVLRGLRTEATGLAGLLVVVALVLAALGGGVEVLLLGAGGAAVVLAFLAALGAVDRAVRHLTMEYRVGGDVVGYDRLFGTAQWRVPGWKLARCEPRRTLADRPFGTRTLVVEHDGRTVRLPHLRDPSAVVPDTSRGR